MQALANWADRTVKVRLSANWSALVALGLTSASQSSELRLRAPAIQGFQAAGTWALGDELTLQKKGGGSQEGFLIELV